MNRRLSRYCSPAWLRVWRAWEPHRAKAFALLGVRTAGDLLGYFPRSYVFESAELPIADLRAEQIHLARGEVIAVDYLTSGAGVLKQP